MVRMRCFLLWLLSSTLRARSSLQVKVAARCQLSPYRFTLHRSPAQAAELCQVVEFPVFEGQDAVADIFISYADPDRERVAELVAILQDRGWTVWWDRDIPAGQDFDTVIEAQLSAARCVLVVWSHASIASKYVKGEAREALESGKLIPVYLEAVKAPMDLRSTQGIYVGDETDEPSAAAVERLLTTIGARLEAATTEPDRGPTLSGRDDSARRLGEHRRRFMGRRGNKRLVSGAFAALLIMGVVTLFYRFPPAFKIKALEDPIEINLNVKVDAEVRVKVEQDLAALIEGKPELF